MASRTLHPSLARRPTLGGVPRKWAAVNGLLFFMLAALFFLAQEWLFIPVWVLVGATAHGLLAKATARDPYAIEAYLRHIRYQRVYPARAHPMALSRPPKTFKTQRS